jgi:hypothetical protein
LSKSRAVRALLAFSGVIVMLGVGPPSVAPGNGQKDAAAVVARFRELLAQRDSKLVIVPFPNSRSRILKADGSSDYFLYMERGGLRGTEAMDSFYAALEAGDTAAADQVFMAHSLVSLRISDFGWNGLGVPMATEGGTEIEDRLYKNVEGVFGPADVSAEDAAVYLEYIETILIPALERGTSGLAHR